MNEQLTTPALHALAEQAVPAGFDRWPSIQARAAARRRTRRTRRAVVAAGGALTVGVAAGLFAWPAGREPLTGEALIGRAEAASLGRTTRSFHLTATVTVFPHNGAPVQKQAEEVWFSGGRQRNEFAGGPVLHGMVGDGTQTWVYAVVNGRTYVARSAKLPGGTTPLAPEEASFAEAVAQLARQSLDGCATPRVENSSATVAGRATHVVTLLPSATPCAPAGKAAYMPERLTVWIDKQTYLPLRSEEVTPKGTVRYEVTKVEYDIAIPDATFRYQPPAGAPVFADLRELKEAIARDTRPADAGKGASAGKP
jgi:outer membrane lipoprotein-sorting protein